MSRIEVSTEQVKLVFVINDPGYVTLERFELQGSKALDSRSKQFMLEMDSPWYKGSYSHPLVQLHVAGDDTPNQHSKKHFDYVAGKELVYQSHELTTNDLGLPCLDMVLASARLEVNYHVNFITAYTFKSWCSVVNKSQEQLNIDYLSSFTYWNLDNGTLKPYDEILKVHIPYNVWSGEAQWKCFSTKELGLYSCYEYPLKRSPAVFDNYFKQISYNHYSFGRINMSSTGGMSSANLAPCAVIENIQANNCYFFQIEHNGSWQWEMGDWFNHVYLNLAGPTFNEHQCSIALAPNESFESVVVAVGLTDGSYQHALAQLNDYRRKIYRACGDEQKLNVIFNTYMNCHMGDDTEENLPALIDKAALAGCEVFCLDCGWYDDGFWWDGVGQWLPSNRRFPSGLKTVLDSIKQKGMIPGLWLEIEVMGIKCELASQWPDECFLMRHGKRVVSQKRYILDFRHPKVVAHANAVIDRVVKEYGVGYIKMDYNTDTGVGTDLNGLSCGLGLLQSNRAYLAWLDGVFARYPDLIIENCGSGGMRLDYAMLQRHSVQSISDQTDYTINGAIAAACASLVTPEQAAIWSYPLASGDLEEVAYNMVNTMLLRIHQSGHLVNLSDERFALVKEAIQTYKDIRADVKTGTPVWPLGMPNIGDDFMAYGIETQDKLYLAVWCQKSVLDALEIPLTHSYSQAKLLYPNDCEHSGLKNSPLMLSDDGSKLAISFPQAYCARLVVLSK